MDIQALGAGALLVSAAEEELRRWGLNPRRPDAEALLLLARWALRRRGVPFDRLSEVSVLSARRSLLLLLRLNDAETEWFPFPDLARALDAAAALPRALEGALAWQGGRYLLLSRSAAQSALLSEYADPLPPREAEGLEEDAALVLDERALGRLWAAIRER